jgi:hypothetical protein
MKGTTSYHHLRVRFVLALVASYTANPDLNFEDSDGTMMALAPSRK